MLLLGSLQIVTTTHLKCRSTTEQEAVATWPIRNAQLASHMVESFESARSLPLPVLVEWYCPSVQSRHLKTPQPVRPCHWLASRLCSLPPRSYCVTCEMRQES